MGTAQAIRDDCEAREVALRTAEALEATLARITDLPSDVVAALEAQAAGGPFPSRPGSPHYVQRLARLIRAELHDSEDLRLDYDGGDAAHNDPRRVDGRE